MGLGRQSRRLRRLHRHSPSPLDQVCRPPQQLGAASAGEGPLRGRGDIFNVHNVDIHVDDLAGRTGAGAAPAPRLKSSSSLPKTSAGVLRGAGVLQARGPARGSDDFFRTFGCPSVSNAGCGDASLKGTAPRDTASRSDSAKSTAFPARETEGRPFLIRGLDGDLLGAGCHRIRNDIFS